MIRKIIHSTVPLLVTVVGFIGTSLRFFMDQMNVLKLPLINGLDWLELKDVLVKR